MVPCGVPKRLTSRPSQQRADRQCGVKAAGRGRALRSRSNWLLAAGALVIVVGTILFAFWRHEPHSAHSFSSTDATLLQIAASPLLALLGWAARQARLGSGSSTPEELVQAQRALASRGLEWWRGVPEPAWPGQIPRAGLRPLEVRWSRVLPTGQAGAVGPVYGGTSDIAGLAARFRATAPCRLVIRGAASCGKSVLARRLMEELLKDSQPGEPVPVFLPLWSWNPGQERLFDWMKRRIGEAYPELRKASYGPNAVAGLVDQGLVLPILDGLDALPEQCRRAVLSDREFLSQDRLILTCRTEEFDAVSGFVVIELGAVDRAEAISFLSFVTAARPGAWEKVDAHLRHCRSCCLAKALSHPRIVYLASIVYGTPSQNGAGSGAGTDNGPAQLIDHALYPSSEAIEKLLLSRLIPALMSEDRTRAQGFPPYGDGAGKWLRNLAGLDLRDPADRKDPAGSDGIAARADPGVSRIAWWNLYRGLRQLDLCQAPLRALAAGLIAFAIITSVLRIDNSWTFSLMTATAFGVLIVIAGAFLGGGEADQRRIKLKRRSRPGTLSLRSNFWTRRRRILLAGVVTFCCFGVLIGLRATLFRIPHDAGTPAEVARRVGFYAGMGWALIIVLTFIIAGVPAPPRTVQAADFDSASRSEVRGVHYHDHPGSYIRRPLGRRRQSRTFP